MRSIHWCPSGESSLHLGRRALTSRSPLPSLRRGRLERAAASPASLPRSGPKLRAELRQVGRVFHRRSAPGRVIPTAWTDCGNATRTMGHSREAALPPSLRVPNPRRLRRETHGRTSSFIQTNRRDADHNLIFVDHTVLHDELEPGFPFSRLTTKLIKFGQSADGCGFGCDWGGAEVELKSERQNGNLS